jgi:tRNA dimethylallyltransferase
MLEIGLQPTNLKERIQRRTADMYEEGLVEETATLLARFGADCPLLRIMGYDEARRLLAGELDRSAAIALTERRTRQYAKRQRTWFRSRHNPVWLGQNRLETGQDIGPTPGAATGAAGDLLRETLELTHKVLG